MTAPQLEGATWRCSMCGEEGPWIAMRAHGNHYRPKGRVTEMTDAMILRSLPARYLDDDGDGYGGIPFISLDEAVRALTTDRESYAAQALAAAPSRPVEREAER